MSERMINLVLTTSKGRSTHIWEPETAADSELLRKLGIDGIASAPDLIECATRAHIAVLFRGNLPARSERFGSGTKGQEDTDAR